MELGLAASPDTLLRRVRQVAAKQNTLPTDLRIVGVDDWAFRKGHRYGTILLDLERRRLVDLLSDRSAESLTAWLKQHPGLEVISRDRAGVYADGARQGAPQAEQVADRWHLLRNLGEAVERLTAQHTHHFRQAAEQVAKSSESESEIGVLPEPVSVSRSEQLRLAHCEQRLALYTQIKEFHQQNITIDTIAKQVGVSKRTVQRFVRAEQFPARARRRRKPRQTDPYEAYLRQRIEAGCRNAAQLHRKIKEQGFRGSYSSISGRVQHLVWALVGGEGGSTAPKARSPVKVPPSRSVAWWLQGHLSSRPEVAAEQKAFLHHLYELAPVLQEAGELAKEFVRLLKKRQGAELEGWLEKASQSACQEIRLFAQGIRQDLAAVRNAMTREWSNGQTEGQVNRLKMLKRQMYGRANFDLLRARVLPMAKAA